MLAIRLLLSLLVLLSYNPPGPLPIGESEGRDLEHHLTCVRARVMTPTPLFRIGSAVDF